MEVQVLSRAQKNLILRHKRCSIQIMKNNKVLGLVVGIILIAGIVLVVREHKTEVASNSQYPLPEMVSPNPTTVPTSQSEQVVIPTPTVTTSPSPTPISENDECKMVTGFSCLEYKNGWISAFKVENNLTDTSFNNYISIDSTNFAAVGTNYEYTVTYTIKKSWITVHREDSMLLYNGTRTQFLSPTQWPIERSTTTNGRVGVSTIHLNDNLAFANSSSAIDYFVSQRNVAGTNSTIYKQDFQYYWNKEAADKSNTLFAGQGGEPVIVIVGTINASQNKCYVGELSLVSRETIYRETPCEIN